MFSIKKSIATALIVTAGMFAVTACTSPNTDNVSAVPGTDSTPIAPPLSANAYPAVGDTVGVVGTGDELACDPSLKTVTPQLLGTIDFNGFTIEHNIVKRGTTYRDTDYQEILFANGQPRIISVIVRTTDIGSHVKEDGTTEYYEYPRKDASVNWSQELSSSSTITFDPIDFSGFNGISLELCIDPTPTTETPTPTPTN